MFIVLQVKTNEDTWFTVAARNVGESRDQQLLARVELVTLRNKWMASGYFPNGNFRITPVSGRD
jgi:hypothetical protein